MKYSTMIKQVSILFVFLMVITISACTTQNFKINDGATFQFKIYDNAVAQDGTIKLLTISNETITYVVYSSNNNLTESFKKKITADKYAKLIDVFNNNNFFEMKERYSPEENTVADVGNAQIIVVDGERAKSVSLEPYVIEYYPDSVIAVAEELQSYIDTMYDLSSEEIKILAEEWIKNTPSYAYDGAELEFKEAGILKTYPLQYVIKYVFKSSQENYNGSYVAIENTTNTSNMINHKIELRIVHGEIVSAIIDNKWDELNQKEIEQIEIKFQPVQCSDTPWKKWYKEGKANFVKEPSQEELIIAYYSQIYDIDVSNFRLISASNPVLAVCGNLESYHIIVTISEFDLKAMLQGGWNILE